jgi:hypothetical protein
LYGVLRNKQDAVRAEIGHYERSEGITMIKIDEIENRYEHVMNMDNNIPLRECKMKMAHT